MNFKRKNIRKWIIENKSIISSVSAVGQMLAVVLGVTIATFEFSLKDRAAERKKVETTRNLMEESWALHQDVLEDLISYQTMTPEERKDCNLLKEINEKRKDVFHFYFRLELCINANLCDETIAKELFCDYAKAEAHRYFETTFEYDDELGFMSKPSHIDLALYRFVTKCSSMDYEEGGEPLEIKSYRKWVEDSLLKMHK